jgi:superfamily II DNA or RNA helicase
MSDILMGKILQSQAPKLFDWQVQHVDQLTNAMRRHGFALDGSDTGTGKTVMGLEVARNIGRIPFVVSPKAVIPSWLEWMKRYRPHDPAYAFTYDKLRSGKTPYLSRVRGKKLQWNLDPSKTVLIFDEVHRCKGDKTLNSKMLAAAKAAGIPTLMLSATVSGSPVDLKAIGYLLEMHGFRDWWHWCLSNNCGRGRFGGLIFNNSAATIKKLHDHIYPNRGSRIRIKELPKGTFPETMIVANGYRIEDTKAYDDIYADMAEELNELLDKTSNYEESALTIQLEARQKAELLKVPVFVELAKDAIEEGNSVAIFVNFRATLDAIGVRLGSLKKGISTIVGNQREELRAESIKNFQNDTNRICLAMIQAGGVGLNLHDVNGDYPRVSIISPSFSAVELRQTLGRVHRAGGSTASVQKIVFAADTVEMGVCRAVRRKLTTLDLLNDDELNPVI